MHSPFALVLFVISAFSISSTFAWNSHVASRSHDHPSIARRQNRVLRLLSDTCVQLEASILISAMVDLVDTLNILDFDLDLFAKADICLCLSSVPLFIQTDVRIQAVVELVGEDNVEIMLTNLIREPGRGRRCDFPDHAIPRPTRAHGCDSCDFTCEMTWERVGNRCICRYPKVECRGKCVETCGSPAPSRRDEVHEHIEIEIQEVVTYDQARNTCDPFDTICGIRDNRDGYGCFDILNNRRNCGGCVWPHPFGSPISPRGRDCEMMEHRRTTWCDSGKCRIKECEEGWRPNDDSSLCIKIEIDINVDL